MKVPDTIYLQTCSDCGGQDCENCNFINAHRCDFCKAIADEYRKEDLA